MALLAGGSQHEESNMIELSVVIPTYNRVDRLRACLEALARQTQQAADFEVIVVIDGGTDDTAKMLSNLNVPFALKVLSQENGGQNIARNHGVDFAQGRYCLFLDDDIIAEPELISEHLQLHRQQEGIVCIGQMLLNIPTKSDWFINTYARGWHQHYEELNQGTREPFWLDCYGGNFSLSRSLFLEVGGFAVDVRRSHDIELGFRLQQSGAAFAYLSRAIGRQDERKDAREMIADLEKSGSAWAILCQRHPDMHPDLLGSMASGLRESLLLEILWRLGVSPIVLAKAGGLFGFSSWGRKWFRLINHYCRWRGFRRTTADQQLSRSLIQGTPILMYHAFGNPGEKASRFTLPIQRFAQQMSWLKRLGYCVISLEEFMEYRRKGSLPPARSIVISIDDGYAELHSLVYPILQRYGFPATIFIVTDKVEAFNDWASTNELRGRQLLSWAQIREMSQNGIQFGAHSRTHSRLIEILRELIQEEIAGSKADLENALQRPITTFAYPFGEFDLTVQSIAEKAGFICGCSAQSGLNTHVSPLFALHRIEIEGTVSLPRFLLALSLGNIS